MSFNQPSATQRRIHYAVLMAGLVGGATGVITFILMAMVFMFAGLHYGHPLALYTGQMHLTPFMMPQGALDGAAWLLMVAAYASLLISIPAFLILYLGDANAN